tara:strand:+ start:86 stop:232 length:147 start_codon:yes stop_codon:yes gene_type:complete
MIHNEIDVALPKRKNLVKNYSDLTKASKSDFLNAKHKKYGISNFWEEL